MPAKLITQGGQPAVAVLHAICIKIWETGKWPSTWTKSIIITIPKKGNIQLRNNYRTISLISHGSKVMLKIILNRLRPLAENIIAEEQAGFRRGRSTIEHIFNLRILCEKHIQHQRNIYHVFIDFKKAFDRVWHEALWTTMKQFNISGKLIETNTKSLRKRNECSIGPGNYGRMVSHISWSSSEVPALPNPLQHISRGYHDTCSRELQRHHQHRGS